MATNYLPEQASNQYRANYATKYSKERGYRCRECGATNKQTRLHVDYILPVAKGGTNDLNNLQTLCEECNSAKYTDE